MFLTLSAATRRKEDLLTASETKLFYEQYANGIMGLLYPKPTSHNQNLPMWMEMKKAGLTKEEKFAVCFGKNGKFFKN